MNVNAPWIKSHPKSTIAAVVALILLFCSIGAVYYCLKTTQSRVLLTVALFVFAHVAFAMWIFTGPATSAKTHCTFAYCYWVAACVMLFCLAFLFLPADRQNAAQNAPSWPQYDGPVGLVLGCSDFPPPPVRGKEVRGQTDVEDQKWVPREIACGNNTSQWLFNLGGKVTLCRNVKSAKELATGAATATAPVQKESAPGATASGSTIAAERASPTASPAPDPECVDHKVTGGMVVPLYFLIVALMGALISLTRHIPEYQGRLSPNSATRITPDEAREYLIFQLMQLFSAPLLALSAYYLVDPGSRAGVIALAFTVGFSSSTILLLIKSLVTKLAPESPSKSAIIVTPDKLDFGDCQLNGNATRIATFTNRGDGPLKVNSVLLGGGDTDFKVETPQTVPFLVASGQSFSLTVVFKPTVLGERSGSVTVADDGFGSPRVVNLRGVGINPPADGSGAASGDTPAPAPAAPANDPSTAITTTVSPPNSQTVARAAAIPAEIAAAEVAVPAAASTAETAATPAQVQSAIAETPAVEQTPLVTAEMSQPVAEIATTVPKTASTATLPPTYATSSAPASKGDPN